MWHTNIASLLICLASILTHPLRTLHKQHTHLGHSGFITAISFVAELLETGPAHRAGAGTS